jgi:hypothetical protein
MGNTQEGSLREREGRLRIMQEILCMGEVSGDEALFAL